MSDIRKFNPWILLALLALAWPPAAQARLVRSFAIDSDVPKCDAIFIGNVTDVSKEGDQDTNGEKLDVLNVATEAVFPVKDSVVQGQRLSFRHFRLHVDSTTTVIINGFTSFNFKTGQSYLLFLKKDEAGRFALLYPEDHEIIRFTPDMVQVAKAVSKRADRTDYVLDIVSKALQVQADECSTILHMLIRSRRFKERLEQPEVRKTFVKKLGSVTRTAKDDNTLLMAYYFLGDLNEVSVIPQITDFIVAGRASSAKRTNAINWLSEFPSEERAKALKVVIDKSKDETVLRYARMKLENPHFDQFLGEPVKTAP